MTTYDNHSPPLRPVEALAAGNRRRHCGGHRRMRQGSEGVGSGALVALVAAD